MAGRIVFPNPHGYALPSKARVQELQGEFGFSDAYASFLLTQNGFVPGEDFGADEDAMPVEVDEEDFFPFAVLYGVDTGNDVTSVERNADHWRLHTELSPYFLPIGAGGNGDLFAEVLTGELKGSIVNWNHEGGWGGSAIGEFFERQGEDYEAMTENERVAFLMEEDRELFSIIAPSMHEFVGHCFYFVRDEAEEYEDVVVYGCDALPAD